MEIKQLYESYKSLENKEISLIGRVRSNRQGKNISFMEINDGTNLKDVQVVYKNDINGYSDAIKSRTGTIVEIKGILIVTEDRKQNFEIKASEIKILDLCSEEYPLQKKEHSLEFLREIAHLRARTKTFNSIYRIRSSAAFAIHKFFQENNFIYFNSPIITSNDAEGAGESFIVTTIDNDKYENDFFGKKASLTVSGQLHGEAFAQAFKKIYTFGPTFRAENSNTSKHAAEFWMIEPEIAFCDLKENINVIEKLVKYVINYLFANNYDDLVFCNENLEENLISKLENVKNSEFKIMEYSKVISVLQIAVKNGHKFENNDIKFGLDLASEHEKYICEIVNQAPTFVINYPKEIKAFYMKLNDDNKTVAAVDLLVPGIGELVGGSQREDNYLKLKNKCLEHNIDLEQLGWYVDLRKYGYYKSSGFGLGFERLIMYVTGCTNIRDVIAFARTPKNLLF